VLGGTGGAVIPQTNWQLWYVDSEEAVGENGVAENAFDGSAGTIWHTQWYGSSPPPPHEIQIDLAGNYSINGFRYLPRQDGFANGTIKNYEFYVSVDGINWGSPVASGTFANTTAVKEVLFNAKSGRYVRLRALSEVNGNPWTSAAELNVLGNGTAFKGYYVAVGDSITWGSHDDIPIDDTSLDLRNTGGGFEPILNNLLTAAKGFPHNVVNAGVSGDASADGAAKISTTLSNHPSADYFLIMYGTNDAWYPPIPSGKGLNPGSPGYSGSYKDHMQQIISAVLGAGKTPYLAKVPYSSQPLLSDASIREYNTVINELVVANGITVTPPDFYTWFQSNPGQLADTVHPNGTGYQSMAGSIPNPYSWFTALTQ
jgi:lysophospholipase L1-like esterase